MAGGGAARGETMLLLLLASVGLLVLALGLVFFLVRRKKPAERAGPAGTTVPEIAPTEGVAQTKGSSKDEERTRLLTLWQQFARRLR